MYTCIGLVIVITFVQMDKVSQESSRNITLLQNQVSELERLVHTKIAHSCANLWSEIL